MAQVRVTQAARNGCAHHEQAAVGGLQDIFFGNGGPKARPAGAGLELGAGVEQSGVAANAAEDTFLVIVRIFVGVGALGAGVASDFERIGRELLAPVIFGFYDSGNSDGVFALARVGEIYYLDGFGKVSGRRCSFGMHGTVLLKIRPDNR